jgi:secreted trypsin-like serine protease
MLTAMIFCRASTGMGRLAAWLAALAMLGGPGQAQGVVRRDDVPESSYTQLGQSSQFACVGMIKINYGSGYQQFASATLIASNVILCAGHVFDQNALAGATGMEFIIGGQTIPIQIKNAGVVHISPGYVNNTNAGVLINDISVVKLSQNSTVTPAAIYVGKSEKGKTGTLVGFGESGTGLTGDENNSSRLAGQNALDVVSKSVIMTDFDSPHTKKYNTYGSATPTALEAQLGPGDSGGSLWIKVNGHWAVAGVNSFGEEGKGKLTFDAQGNPIEDYYGWLSGYTRVSNFVTFIKKYATVRVVSDTTGASARPADDLLEPAARISLRLRPSAHGGP